MQSPSPRATVFNGHNLARDLLSHIRSRSSVFTYRLSTTVVAPATRPIVLDRLAYSPSIPSFRSSFVCVVYQNCNSDYQIRDALACRYSPAARKACLLDRIRDPPIAQELKRNADPLINALNWQGVSFARSTQRPSTASSTRITRFPNRNCGALRAAFSNGARAKRQAL
jgi:hypothetical protein